jgi:type I restriction enzyme S subunit
MKCGSIQAKHGWEEGKLSSFVADFIVPQRDKPKVFGGDIPWCRIEDFNGIYLVDSKSKLSVSKETIQKMGLRVYPTDTVLVSCSADLGRCAIVGRPLVTNQTFIGLVPSGRVDPLFLYYYMTNLASVLNEMASGATIKYLSKEKFQDLRVCFPLIPAQKHIVGILDEAFDGIAIAKANAEKNLQNARALFESHLAAVFAQRDRGWERVVPLSSVLSVQPRNGWSPPAEYQTGTGVPVLTLSSVTGFEYDGSRVKLSSAPTREGAHYWLEPNELLITRSNTRELVAHVAIYDGTPPKAICCDLIMKMRVDPTGADTRFVYYYLRSPEARIYFTSRAQGASSTMKKIGKKVVQDIPIPVPCLEQQKSVVAILDALAAETQRLESIYGRKLAALDALKKSLLHEAFSGQL